MKTSETKSRDTTYFLNLNLSSSNFVFRNNTFRNVRRFGILMQTHDGLVEENTFDGVSTSAIIVRNSAGWPEGFATGNIVIRGNTIRDCNFDGGLGSFNAGDISVHVLRNDGRNGLSRAISRVEIVRNTVINTRRRAINIASATDTKIVDNIIRCEDPATPVFQSKEITPIHLLDVDRITVHGNTIIEPRTVVSDGIATEGTCADVDVDDNRLGQEEGSRRAPPTEVAGRPAAEILELLGAKLEDVATRRQIREYSSHFDRLDGDGDGRHSKTEYIDKGGYLTPQARRGIFNAADHDKDGFVTKAEYVLNRIITDEAKNIVQGMDSDKDGLVQRREFIQHATERFSSAELTQQVFAALDSDGNAEITIPEYLRVWGKWARAGQSSAEDRIAARQAELDRSSDSAASTFSLEDSRRRAAELRPRLVALMGQFEARTFDASDGLSIPYRLFEPQPVDPESKYPLVVYLHGSGGRGTDNLKQISGGNLYGSRLWALAEIQAKHPCFVLAPQLTQGVSSPRTMRARGEKIDDARDEDVLTGKWELTVETPAGERRMELTLRKEDQTWGGTLRVPRRGTMTLVKVLHENGHLTFLTSDRMLLKGEFTLKQRRLTGRLATVGNRQRAAGVMALIRSVIKEFPVDERRLYITGQSMGGSGTWGMLAAYPDVFAAAVPVCGTGDVTSAPAIVAGGTAVWSFHGDADPTVPVQASRKMFAALHAAGGFPKYTEFRGVKHDSWVDAYPNPALHRWLFGQTRRK
jgi:poly(3-hydroxybutyrate) depolymerase/Ca2+-binding EF-hand superfamily protein